MQFLRDELSYCGSVREVSKGECLGSTYLWVCLSGPSVIPSDFITARKKNRIRLKEILVKFHSHENSILFYFLNQRKEETCLVESGVRVFTVVNFVNRFKLATEFTFDIQTTNFNMFHCSTFLLK